MKKNKLLLTLSSFAIALSVSTLLAACNNQEGSSSLDTSQQETVVEVALQVASMPTKTSYKVGEALDFAGLVVKKVTTTDGVSDAGVTLSNADLSFSVSDGTVLSEAGTLTVTVSYPDDPEVKATSFNVAVADKETYTVSFENYDGTVLDTETTKEGGTISYGGESPKKTSDENYGYTFVGWYVKGDSSQTVVDVDNYAPTGNVTFVAKYASWDANSGDGTLTYSYSDSYGENGGYYVTGFDSDAEDKTVVKIPAEFKGKPVTGIAANAFRQKTTIEKIIFGNTLEFIGENAFYGDSSIKGAAATEEEYVQGTFTLPASVKTLSKACFRGLKLVTKLVVGSVNLKEIPEQAFYGFAAAATLTLNEGIETIGVDAFNGIAATQIVLPDSLTTLSSTLTTSATSARSPSGNPFSSAKIIKIKLGKGLTAEAFEASGFNYKMTTLVSYEVDKDNPNFAVVDDVLYSKDMTKLVAFPWAKASVAGADGTSSTEFVVPSTVTRVCDYAFGSGSSNTKLTKFTMSDALKEIGRSAFHYRKGATFVFGENSQLETIGYAAFYGCEMGTSMPTSTTYAWVLPNSVKEVGDFAFSSESKLTSFTFGTGMEKFGRLIFDGYKNLSISFPSEGANYVVDADNDLVYNADSTKLLWFVANSAKTSITIKDTVTEIGDFLFYNSTKVTSLTMGSNVKKIGEYAFSKMTGLTALALPEALTYIGDNAFNGDSKITTMNVPANLEYIGENAFASCKLAELGAVTIKEGAQVGASAFSNCAKMTTLVYNAAELSENAFIKCTGLTSVTLNNAITVLPENVFSGCSAITSLNIPTSLVTIETTALTGTSKLVDSVELPSTLTTLEDKALSGVAFKKVTIPASVTEMGNSMFESATTEEVVFNNTFETLPENTFKSSKVAIATFPDELKVISTNAFRSATEFTTLSFPNVTTIYYAAFYEATGLTTLNAPMATNFPTGENVTFGPFYKCSSLSSLTLGDIDTYGNAFFYGCSSLDVSIQSAIKYIGSYAFQESGITNFEMGDDVRFAGFAKTETDGKILGHQFEGATHLQAAKLNSSVTELYDSMFRSCSSLTTLTLAGTLATVNTRALQGTKLATLPDLSSVTSLGMYAFADMTALTTATLPTDSSVTSLPQSLFAGDSALPSITIPANITSIEKLAFQKCTSLTDVYFKSLDFNFNCTSYASGVFVSSGATTFHFEDFTMEEVSASAKSQFIRAKTGLAKNAVVNLVCSDGTLNVTIA